MKSGTRGFIACLLIRSPDEASALLKAAQTKHSNKKHQPRTELTAISRAFLCKEVQKVHNDGF